MKKLSRTLLLTSFALSIGQYTQTMDSDKARQAVALQYAAYKYIDRDATLSNISTEEKATDPQFSMKLLKLGLLVNQLKTNYPDLSNDVIQSMLRDNILNLPPEIPQTGLLLSCEPFISKLVFRAS